MPNFLVVDDDSSIRTLLAHTLRGLGDVETTPSGDLAVSLLAVKRYDAIVLDLHMTPMDGFSVLAFLRTCGGPNAKTPVFVCTADRTARTRERALGAAAYFLEKPVRPQLLTTLVAGLIGVDPRRRVANAPPSVNALR